MTRVWLALFFLCGCEGATCGVLREEPVPVGYCGTDLCNGCRCEERDGAAGTTCTLQLCGDADDACRATGAHRQLCQREDVFEPCDLQLSAREQCYRDHGRCTELSTGECAWVDDDTLLAACLERAD